MTDRQFSLGAILSHTTGRMLAELDEMWELQDHMVGRMLFTHERARDEFDCTPALLVQFPELAEAEPPDDFPVDPTTGDKRPAVQAWVAAVAEHVGWSTSKVRGPGVAVLEGGEG